MTAPLIFLALDIATVVCAVLLAIRVLATRPLGRSGWLFVAIMACNTCHVVLSRHEYGPWIPPAFRIDVGGWGPALNLARNLTPGLFMLLSQSLFSERGRFPRWLLVLFGLQVFLEEPVRWFMPLGARPDWANLGAAALQMLFAGAAIYWAVSNWRGDLVETRRRLRVATVLVVGLDMIVENLALRVVIPSDTPANAAVHELSVAINLAILAFVLLRFTGRDLARYLAPVSRASARPSGPRPAATRPPGVAATESAAALDRLTALLEVERIYRQPGLSLSALADRVGLPEYRLRRLIHEGLGYRNFNLFLHHYRIGEACEQLRDPALRRLPILTIALSVGYQSINTFNRGFAEVVGVAPSAYRAGVASAEAPAGNPAPKPG